MLHMPWSSIDSVLFEAHLQSTLAAIDAALAHVGCDTLVVHAGEPRMLFQDDQASPFRVNPWFAWLVPAPPAPGSLLRIRRGARPRTDVRCTRRLLAQPSGASHRSPWITGFDLRATPTRQGRSCRARSTHWPRCVARRIASTACRPGRSIHRCCSRISSRRVATRRLMRSAVCVWRHPSAWPDISRPSGPFVPTRRIRHPSRVSRCRETGGRRAAPIPASSA